mmetsp:Transcript_58423/g.162872  ORF Transcript_58423/g.162872 Transcript_58423/m.162872 type:complete len:201 (-) Transcript_58423:310-912(-)
MRPTTVAIDTIGQWRWRGRTDGLPCTGNLPRREAFKFAVVGVFLPAKRPSPAESDLVGIATSFRNILQRRRAWIADRAPRRELPRRECAAPTLLSPQGFPPLLGNLVGSATVAVKPILQWPWARVARCRGRTHPSQRKSVALGGFQHFRVAQRAPPSLVDLVHRATLAVDAIPQRRRHFSNGATWRERPPDREGLYVRVV